MRKTCRRYNTPGDTHFLTFSCFRRYPFLRSERTLKWLGDSVTRACEIHEVSLWGYVFMPEHVHLLVKPAKPEYAVSNFLASVKESVTRKAIGYRSHSDLPDTVWEPFYDIQPNGKVHFRVWQRGGGYDRNIQTASDILEKLLYMHNNPVKRGLCSVPADWAWSSARFYAGMPAGSLSIEKFEA